MGWHGMGDRLSQEVQGLCAVGGKKLKTISFLAKTMDTRSQCQGGQNLSSGGQDGKGVGSWDLAERCLVRGEDMLRESRLRAHCTTRAPQTLCHDRGGELEQIQFLLGHASVQNNGTLTRLQAESRTSGE
jgi:hypothetical protein